MHFIPTKLSGVRIVGPTTKLGHLGPKHHGLIIGDNIDDKKTYVAERNGNGCRYVTFNKFVRRYKHNGKIKLFPNDGKFTGYEVAKRAIKEIKRGGNGKFDILLNNCESFVNRAMYGKSISSQVVHTVSAVVLVVGIGLIFRKKAVAA